MKIIGLGVRYFKDGWNVFDFIVAIGSIVGIILNEVTSVSIRSSTSILRSFRILRVFKLFRKQKSLKIIYETFIVTLPALVNVGGLLMLLVFIYAVLCMTLFAEVQLNGPMTQNLNFQTITASATTLFLLSTGNNLDNSLMHSKKPIV